MGHCSSGVLLIPKNDRGLRDRAIFELGLMTLPGLWRLEPLIS
jgi:hypothetical protein